MDMKQDKALDALRRTEDGPAWKRAAAWIIVDTKDPDRWGKLKVAYPADGMGPLKAFLWDADRTGVQYGHAAGCGYNKLSAALDGLTFAGVVLSDAKGWESQLRAAGFSVIQVI